MHLQLLQVDKVLQREMAKEAAKEGLFVLGLRRFLFLFSVVLVQRMTVATATLCLAHRHSYKCLPFALFCCLCAARSMQLPDQAMEFK